MINILRYLKDLNRNINTLITKNDLNKSATVSTESICQDEYNLERGLIVSLTTFSKRIYDVHLVIESIARQTLKPNKVILWLDEEEFTCKDLPEVLKKQVKRGLQIEYCENLRSYKKIIPTLKKYPDSNIITIDDDILYPSDMIDRFVKEHDKNKDLVLCNRGHEIKIDERGKVRNYSQWTHEVKNYQPGRLIFPTGVGGVFYPSGCFYNEVTQKEIFMDVAPTADDVWLKTMTLLAGKYCKIIQRNASFFDEFLLLEESQDIGLLNQNVILGENDKQISKVFSKYKIRL